MGSDNRRQAVRVDCDLTIRLQGVDGEFLARIVDLSRTGLRIRLRGDELGLHRLASLVQITRVLTEVLGDTFYGELHYEMLGPLVKRNLKPTRIAKRDWEHTDIEIGCSFDRPLTGEESGMLGVALPAIGCDDRALELEGAGPLRRKPGERPEPRGPRLNRPEPAGYTAYLYPAPGKTAKPLVTRTRSLTRGMAILDITPGQGWESTGPAVSDVIMSFDEAYGTAVLIRIVDGEDDLWAGPAEVKEVDVVPGSVAIKLGLTFCRELRAEELGRLGLPRPA